MRIIHIYQDQFSPLPQHDEKQTLSFSLFCHKNKFTLCYTLIERLHGYSKQSQRVAITINLN